MERVGGGFEGADAPTFDEDVRDKIRRAGPEGLGPGPRARRWSWILLAGLVGVLLAGIGLGAWAMWDNGRAGLTLMIAGVALVIGVVLLRLWPVIAAGWLRRGDRGGP